jgi:hypothetical protein
MCFLAHSVLADVVKEFLLKTLHSFFGGGPETSTKHNDGELEDVTA